ncbi:hypothetical protein [Arenimonas sp.]|uniref:hypothetical protein n=1 Tax=Arenimonas sp. TaxID=1872635 RepID=UPI0035AE0A4C
MDPLMSPDQAESVAEKLLGPAREESARAQARIARRRQAFSRLSTGAATLVAYYFGHKLALEMTDSPLLQQALAVTIGLVAAVLWQPGRRQS